MPRRVFGRPPRHWTRRLATTALLAAMVALGAALRFGRLDEMEYKADEAWTYTHAMRIPAEEPWPLLGMRSSVALPNAALSLLLFVGLAKTGRVQSPVDLDARVVALNVAALALVFVFAEVSVDERSRPAWRWGGALAAVSPFAILLQRKIWAQSTLPLFAMLFLIAWWHRDRRWGAFAWGLVGACLGQIHMSGFFFAAGFAAWAWYAGREREQAPVIRWRWFIAGSLVGGVGVAIWVGAMIAVAVAWLRAGGLRSILSHISMVAPPAGHHVLADIHVLSLWPSFWVNWFFDATGAGLDYSLGPNYRAFLRTPVVFGHGTWLTLAATGGSVVIAASAAGPWALALARDLRRRRLPDRLRRCSETAFTEGAALGGFGLLLTASLRTINRHYLIVAYPLPWVWLSRLLLNRRRGRLLLASVWVMQLLTSWSYLGYIHAHHGAEGGDYGRGYRWQTPSERGSQGAADLPDLLGVPTFMCAGDRDVVIHPETSSSSPVIVARARLRWLNVSGALRQ